MEEWWDSPNSWRQEWTTNGETTVTQQTPDGLFQSKNFRPMSTALALLVEQVLHPVDQEEVDESKAENNEGEVEIPDSQGPASKTEA